MEKVFQYIEDNAEMYIDWLIQACNQPSVAEENRGMFEMKELVSYCLKDLGADVTEIKTNGYPIIYGEISTNKAKTLMFYNHYDVQPEPPLQEWFSPPFEATRLDGKLFARGAADNKGNLMARLCAIHAYQMVYKDLPVNIKFVFEGEEEVGSPNLSFFSHKHPEKLQSDGIIWEGGSRDVSDKRPHVGLGVKGICYVEMICEGANHDLHSSEAAIVENPAWRLVWALNTIKNEQEDILLDGFYDDVVPLTTKDQEVIESMNFNESEIKKAYGLDNFLKNVTGYDLKERLTAEPTCTICGFYSGYTGDGSKTVLPSTASVKLDFRLVPNQTPENIAELLRAHLDKHHFTDIKIKQSVGMVPFTTNPDHDFVSTVLKSIKEVYTEPPVILRNLAGSSPMSKMLKNTSIPAVQIGVANTQSNVHAPNENILITDYIQGIKATANVIHNMNLSV